jgi:hypothetical protein
MDAAFIFREDVFAHIRHGGLFCYSVSKSSVHFVGFASRTFVLSSLRLRVHE